jgi:hypothetical protein
MIQIRKEANEIISGKQPKDNNLLKNAPHPISVLTVSDAEWNRYAFLPSSCRLDTDRHTDHTPGRQPHTLHLGFMSGSSGRRSRGSTMVRGFMCINIRLLTEGLLQPTATLT